MRAAIERENRWLLDALAVGRAQPRGAPETAAESQGVGSTDARHRARAEKSVGFHAASHNHREPLAELVTHFQISGLVVAPGGGAIFDFIFIAGREAAVPEIISRLLDHAGAIVFRLKRSVGRRVLDQLKSRFESGELMLPVIAGGEVPGQVRRKIVDVAALSGSRRRREAGFGPAVPRR